MKKKVVVSFLLLVTLVVGVLASRPYVAVSLDEAGFAVRVRTSVHQKFAAPIIYWQK